MTTLYHRDLRRRIARLEEHYLPEPPPEVYQCWKTLAGDVAVIYGRRLTWVAGDHPPGTQPPAIPCPPHLPPPLVVELRTSDP